MGTEEKKDGVKKERRKKETREEEEKQREGRAGSRVCPGKSDVTPHRLHRRDEIYFVMFLSDSNQFGRK